MVVGITTTNISAELTDQTERLRERLARTSPFTRIVSLMPGVGWRAAVADRDGTAHLVPTPYLAVVEPLTVDHPAERRMVAVVAAEDGRLLLDADVRALVYLDGDDELRELAEDLLRASVEPALARL